MKEEAVVAVEEAAVAAHVVHLRTETRILAILEVIVIRLSRA